VGQQLVPEDGRGEFMWVDNLAESSPQKNTRKGETE